MMKNGLKAGIVLLLCILPQLIIAQDSVAKKQLAEEIQQQLDSLQQTREFPGATFAAILPDGEIIEVASGIADSLHKEKMNTERRMLAGSNGKTLFIAAILTLYEEGLFDLDDPISKYLSDEEWFEKLPNSGVLLCAC